MAVYRPTKDSKVWWYEFIFEGQRVRESAKTRSKTVAKDAEKARRRELEQSYNGIKRRDRAKLFSVAADEWFALRRKSLHNPFGISRAVRSALSSLWVGRRPIKTQKPDSCRVFEAYRARQSQTSWPALREAPCYRYSGERREPLPACPPRGESLT